MPITGRVVGGQYAGQMGGLAGGGDDHAEALYCGIFGKGDGLHGSAVGGIDMYFMRDIEFGEYIDGFFYYRQIAVAAHDNGYFFHNYGPPE